MITTVVGYQFLQQFNAKRQAGDPPLTPEDFFKSVLWPLFYDHPKTMYWVFNSAFNALEVIEKKGYLPERRAAVRDVFLKQVQSGNIHAGNAVGYYAGIKKEPKKDMIVEYGTTSAQVTGQLTGVAKSLHDYYTTPDEAFVSWIGGAMGIGTSSGLSVFIQEPTILSILFEGWKHYRWFLNHNRKLRPRQLDGWNGQWLAHVLSDAYDPNNPREGFSGLSADGELVERIHWSKLMYLLSQFIKKDSLVTYMVSFGNTNTTLGYIPIQLGEIRDLYERFGQQNRHASLLPEEYLSPEATFLRACMKGAINVESFQPEGLEKFLSRPDQQQPPRFPKPPKTPTAIYDSYTVWLEAKLGAPELAQKAGELTNILLQLETYKPLREHIRALLNLTGSQASSALANLQRAAKKDQQASVEKLVQTIQALDKVTCYYFINLIRFYYANQKTK